MQDFDSPKLQVQFMVSWTVLESIWCHLDANVSYFGPTWGFFFMVHLLPMPGRAIGTRMVLGFLARVPFRDPPFDNCLARWDHLTVPNIGNSISDLQISTLGTRICNWA